MKSIPVIHPAITENTENVFVKCAPQKINYWKTHMPVRFVLSYILSVIRNISKEQHEKHLQPLRKIQRIYS